MARPAKKVIETVIEPIIEGPQQPIETVYNQEINLADDQYLFDVINDDEAMFQINRVKLVNCIVRISGSRKIPVIQLDTKEGDVLDESQCIDNLTVQIR